MDLEILALHKLKCEQKLVPFISVLSHKKTVSADFILFWKILLFLVSSGLSEEQV